MRNVTASLAMAIVVCFMFSVSDAAVYTVPGSYTNIQTAVNAVPDGSTILVSAGTYSDYMEFLDVNKDLLIKSVSGAAATIIDGGSARKLLRIDSSTGNSDKNVIFDGFTFRNGRESAGALSPVSVVNAKPHFLNCIFTNNSATVKAGAVLIYGTNTSPAFLNCSFLGNSSDEASGAVLVNGNHCQALFRDCRFYGNSNRTPSGNAYAEGGALYFSDAGGRVIDCIFKGNSASYAGGAIQGLTQFSTSADNIYVSGCRFEDNYCMPVAGREIPYPSEGGAIMIEGNVNLDLSGSMFAGNYAMSGGAIQMYRANLVASNCVFRANRATGTNYWGFGGAIGVNNYDADGTDRREGVTTIANCTMISNTAPVGGGLYVGGDGYFSKKAKCYINNLVVAKCTSTDDNASYGNAGGMYMGRLDCWATNFFLLGNTSEGHGGALVINETSDVRLYDSCIVGNNALGADDAIHMPDASSYTGNNVLLAYNGGSPSATTSSFAAYPPISFDGEAYMAYIVATSSPSSSISPYLGGLEDNGGWTAGATWTTNMVSNTTFYLTSHQPTQQVAVTYTLRGRTGVPYQETARNVPGRVEAEHFDNGGEGVAYHDSSAANYGESSLRGSESVDVNQSGAFSGTNMVGWISAGEWMEYTLNVTTAAFLKVQSAISSVSTGQYLYLQLDGADVTGLVSLPNTGAWSTWQEVDCCYTVLNAGRHTLRVFAVTDGFSLDYIQFTLISTNPLLRASSSSLTRYYKQGKTVTPQSFAVSNWGPGVMSYTIDTNAAWFYVSPTGGTSSGEADNITVGFNTAALATGVYNGTITISSPEATNSPVTVGVTLRVLPPMKVRNDFDGDGKTDLGVYYPPGGNWYVFGTQTGFYQDMFGYAGTVPVTGDFDGDGKTDLGVYYAPGGNWYIFGTSMGFVQFAFGYAGTIPVAGDFDGDGKDDIGVYYPPGGNWYVFGSSSGFYEDRFGYAGTIPIVADYDGDGRADLGVYYPPGGNWYIFGTLTGFYQDTFGYEGTIPVAGDFDGDGRADLGVYYPPGGNWYIFGTATGFHQDLFGYAGTVPVIGDFDGDNKDDIGVYYAPGGNWYVFGSSSGFYEDRFGYSGTTPVGTTQTSAE